MSKNTKNDATQKKKADEDGHAKVPAKPAEPADDNPAVIEGGVLSPLDGKFEADHRPSR